MPGLGLAPAAPRCACSGIVRAKSSAPRRIAPDLGRPGLPGEDPLDTAHIPEAYWRAFSVAAFAMNRFIVDHMIRASRQFDNDLEGDDHLRVPAHLNIAHLMPPGTRPS